MIILCFASIFLGYITRDIYLGFGSPFNSIFIHPNNLSIIDTELSINIVYKLLPLILTILGTIVILVLYEFYYKFICEKRICFIVLTKSGELHIITLSL